MKKLVPFFCMLLAIGGCRSKQSKIKVTTDLSDTAKFFPVTPFFKEQIAFVDLRNFSIKKSTSQHGKKDTVIISHEAFITTANLFLEAAKEFEANKYRFKENVFRDLSTNSYTLNYTPVDASLSAIQNIDILLAEETNYPKRVFIKKSQNKGDTSITEQYNWRANKGLQITRYRAAGSQYAETAVTNISWQ